MCFNLYNKIISVTGTIGDITNESLLKINYHVNIFKIPRNKVSKKLIYSKPRSYKLEEIFSFLVEMLENDINRRPVLVILDYPSRRIHKLYWKLFKFNYKY